MNEKQIVERLRELIESNFLVTENPEFAAFVAMMPEKYWAKYDLSAVRLGWEAADLLERMAWQPIETAPIGAMILCADMHAKEAQHWAFVGWRYAGIANGCVTTPERETQPATHWMPLPDPPSE